MNFYTRNLCRPPVCAQMPLRVMKLTIILLTTAILQVSASSFAQRVTLNLTKAPLTAVFKEIRKQTGYDFFYTDALLANTTPVSIKVKNLDVKEALAQCLNNQGLTYSIQNSIIVINASPAEHAPPPKDNPRHIIGRVVDESNQPLPGVSIKIKGSPVQTVTTIKGNFYITADENAVLLFSYVGYEPRKIALEHEKDTLYVVMKVNVGALDQVQVTAYGTTTKRFNAGDITTITAKDIEKNPVNNVLEALQGKIPGLFIQQVTGQPGGAFKIQLRTSTNLFVGAVQPLIVVDGVRYPGGTLPLATNSTYGTENFLQGGSGLNYINPNDIESINVLKDVDATAIYGSAGAYGVIIITTKKAKADSGPTLNANIYSGVSVLGETPKLLNTQQYIMLRLEAIKNDGFAPTAQDLDVNGTWPADRDVDWRKVYLGAYAENTNADLSYSGGSKNTSYLVSGSLRSYGNIQRHKGSDGDGSLRFSLNTSTDDKKFSLGLSATYLSSKDDMVPYDFSAGALTPPNAPNSFNPDGTINWAAIGTNPQYEQVANNANRLYSNITSNLLANATLVYHPVKDLTLRTILGYNDIIGRENIGNPSTTFNPATTNALAQAVGIFHHYDTRSITISPYAEYDKTIAKKGALSVKFGGEVDDQLSYYDELTGTGFPSDALLSDPSASYSTKTDYNLTRTRSISAFGIINYIWDKKYVLDINTRRDGSIKFGPGRRFGNFGSIAGAWIFSEESFIKNNLPFLSFGKLRASTGIVGGDALPYDYYLSIYQAVGQTYEGASGLNNVSLYNPYLEWEKDHDSEVGLELGFLNDKIYVEGSYYRNIATNQLVDESISTVTGFSNYYLNSNAVIRTSGWEVDLTSHNISSKNFSWTTRFNISIPTSKLDKAPTNSKLPLNLVVGKPVTGILLYKYNGVNPATGYYNFTNAAGVSGDFASGLQQVDKTQFVDLAPKYYGGFQNTITYKQISLDFSINYTNRVGQNFLGQQSIPFGIFNANGSTIWLQRWQKPGDITSVPKVSSVLNDIFRQQLFQASTGAYTDATYARLQNVSIRYRFKKEFVQKLSIKDLTVYLQGQNLLTVSKFGGLDPENLNAGVIPPMRVFTAGINLTL